MRWIPLLFLSVTYVLILIFFCVCWNWLLFWSGLIECEMMFCCLLLECDLIVRKRDLYIRYGHKALGFYIDMNCEDLILQKTVFLVSSLLWVPHIDPFQSFGAKVKQIFSPSKTRIPNNIPVPAHFVAWEFWPILISANQNNVQPFPEYFLKSFSTRFVFTLLALVSC